MDQSQFAELIGKSIHTIQSIEAGRLVISESLARQIAGMTGVDPKWTLGEDPDKPPVIWGTDRLFTKTIFDSLQRKRVPVPDRYDRMFADLLLATFAIPMKGPIIAASKDTDSNTIHRLFYEVMGFIDDLYERYGGEKENIDNSEVQELWFLSAYETLQKATRSPKISSNPGIQDRLRDAESLFKQASGGRTYKEYAADISKRSGKQGIWTSFIDSIADSMSQRIR